MSILKELYLGNIVPNERDGSPEYTKALSAVVRSQEAMLATMTEEQKELYNAYHEAETDMRLLSEQETFAEGFTLGAQIMMEVLMRNQMENMVE